MTDSAEFINRSNQSENIQVDILTKLNELRQEFPERFPKRVYVLAAVDGNVNDQCEERFRQAKENQTGKRVTLIPYNSGDFHWIGVLLEFKVDEQIERAEFIDPVKQSNFVPDKLQKQFAKVYPNVILRSKNFQKCDDRKHSATLTVENLLKAAEKAQLPEVNYPDEDHLHNQITDHSTTNVYFSENNQSNECEEKPSVSTSVSSKGIESKLHQLKIRLNSLQDKLKLKDTSKLSEKIQRTERRIKEYEEDEETEEVEREKIVLSDLWELQVLKEEICFLEKSLKIDKETSPDIWKEEEYPITEETVRNMYKDFCSMPYCSERSIICLLFYVSLKLAGNTINLDHSIKVSDQIETEISKELDCLAKRLKIEELESSEVRYSLQAASVNIKNKNWKRTLTILRKLFKQLQPLDMQELFRLVEKVDDAAHLIKNKEIILFLGGTGSGKSTTIHFLSGSKMVEQIVAGLNHIAPIKIKNTDLKKITTSPFARSETRYITPVTVNFEDVDGYSNGSIILCDTPGFGYTNGPEVDIANGIGIFKAIKGCKSVKPVVICSYKSLGDQCAGIKDLAHVLVGLIPGIQDYIKSFSYIFTKFPDKERKTIHKILEDINKKLRDEEKSDISYTNFLKDILQKTRRGARVLDPINDNPGEILDELAETTTISHPEEVFQFSITEKSKTIVQEHIRMTQLSIMSATKRFEYLFVKYKLDQLKYLSELLGQNYIESIYNDCIRYISEHLSEEYQEGIAAINQSIMKQTILNNEDLQQYQIRIEHAKLAEELRNKHLGKEVIHSNAFIQYLNQQVDIMLEDLREKDIHHSSVKLIWIK